MALKAHAEKGKGKLDAEAKEKTKKTLENSLIKMFVYGGSSGKAEDLNEGYSAFARITESSRTFSPSSPGVPIAYKFRRLANSQLAQISLTTQYTLVKPLQITQRVRLTFLGLYCTMADDEGRDDIVEMDRLHIVVRAFNKKDLASPLVPAGPDQYLVQFETGGEVAVSVGQTILQNEGREVLFDFDTDQHEFNLAEIHFVFSAREYDANSGNEEASGTAPPVKGASFFKASLEPVELRRAEDKDKDVHVFIISDNNDFRFDARVRIEMVSVQP